jgi:DNA-binding IclR family transcriptional regulator
MSKNAKAPAKPSTEEAVKKALKTSPGATAEGVASAASIGRSTAGKVLARLTQAGEVSRTEGGREEGRRLPDRYSLRNALTGSGSSVAQAKDSGGADVKAPANRKGSQSKAATPATPPALNGVDRLRPGQLEGLVITYLKENAATGPHGPTGIARALERSSGAVGNCLVRLAEAKQVRQVTDKPRRYSLAG